MLYTACTLIVDLKKYILYFFSLEFFFFNFFPLLPCDMEITLVFIDFATCVYTSFHSHSMYIGKWTLYLKKSLYSFVKGPSYTSPHNTTLFFSFILCDSAACIALKNNRHCSHINYNTYYKESEDRCSSPFARRYTLIVNLYIIFIYIYHTYHIQLFLSYIFSSFLICILYLVNSIKNIL